MSYVGLLSFENTFAQNNDNDDDFSNAHNNVIGQDGDRNKAIQEEEASQGTEDHSMCVSGESISLSCNNLSSQLRGLGSMGSQGPPGPSTLSVYIVSGTGPVVNDFGTAQADCRHGDIVLGGGMRTNGENVPMERLEFEPLNEGSWKVSVGYDGSPADASIVALARCLDVTP